MMQVGGSFPFTASDQLLSPYPSAGGSSDPIDPFASSETSSPGTSPSSWQVPASSVTPSASYSWELYPYSLGESESVITRTGVPGTDASGWRGFANICPRNFIAKRMAIAIRNVGGNWMRLGLFDANGDRLAVTDRFPPVANTIVVAALENPVQLLGSNGFYLSYWSDDFTGNLQFSVLSGRSISDRSPLMQRCDPNESAGNIAHAFDFTPLRPWLAVFE